MILATTTVEDFDRFKRSSRPRAESAEHGSKGATVFRDPNRTTGLGALRLGRGGLQSFVSDPEVPRSCRKPGTRAAQAPSSAADYDA